MVYLLISKKSHKTYYTKSPKRLSDILGMSVYRIRGKLEVAGGYYEDKDIILAMGVKYLKSRVRINKIGKVK